MGTPVPGTPIEESEKRLDAEQSTNGDGGTPATATSSRREVNLPQVQDFANRNPAPSLLSGRSRPPNVRHGSSSPRAINRPMPFKRRPGSGLISRRSYGSGKVNGDEYMVSQGIAIPQGMALPMEDGYRTPTIEDYERAGGFPGTQRNGRVKIETPGTPGNMTPKRSFARHLSVDQLALSLDKRLSWKIRIRYFTWAAFAMNMATGGIANVLYSVPFRFNGIDTIGTIFFLFNLVLFLINCSCMSMRFYFYPETFKASLTHPTESLFVPASVVSLSTILLNIGQYGLYNTGPWLNTTCLVLFWMNSALAILASSGTYLMLWSSTSFTIAQMTPTWIFPAYPLLVIGPQAALLSKVLPPDQAIIIIIAGFTMQGIGYLVSIMIYAAYIYRLMTQKLPNESSRPGMFVSVGPSGFTAGAIINLGANVGRAFGPDFPVKGQGELSALILKLVADWMALWIWGLACWFFLIAVGAHITCIGKGKLTFSLPFFSFVFPNTALIGSTFAVAKAFDCYGLNVMGCVLTVALIAVWFWVFGLMIRAIWMRTIFWPQVGEDRDEGGFKAPQVREDTPGGKLLRRSTALVDNGNP